MPNPATATPTAEAPADTPPSAEQTERIADWPPDNAFQQAEEIKQRHGYYDPDSPKFGRLSAATVNLLTRVAQTIATPEVWITTEPEKEGKPYVSTGLTSLQPQIDVMNAIFGLAHWRLLVHEVEDGVLDLELVLGNDLDALTQAETGEAQHATEVLARHRMRGSHTRGRSHGDRYKGALTNGGKRLLAMAGACADVGRFTPEPDEAHNTATTGDRDRRKPSDKQVAFLARLVRENAGGNIERWVGKIQQLADVDEQPPETITEDYVRGLLRRLDRQQVKTMIDALIAVRDARTPTATPTPGSAGAPPASGAPTTASEADGGSAGDTPATAGSSGHAGDGDVVTVDFTGAGPDGPSAA